MANSNLGAVTIQTCESFQVISVKHLKIIQRRTNSVMPNPVAFFIHKSFLDDNTFTTSIS